MEATADPKMEQPAGQKWSQLLTPKWVGSHMKSETGGPGDESVCILAKARFLDVFFGHW